MESEKYVYAIVGLGPRGHYALECLIAALVGAGVSSGIHMMLFEETEHLGNGPVWATDQAKSNWVNVNERALDLPERPFVQFGEVHIPAFPNYQEWAGLDFDKCPQDRIDTYPPRSKAGQYMADRFKSLFDALASAEIVTLVNDSVDDIVVGTGSAEIITKRGETYQVDQVLLTVGHQPTECDAQILEWKALVKTYTTLHLYTEPYPVERFIESMPVEKKQNVAIRGYGLATIDVIRAYAAQCGTFHLDDERTRSQHFVPDDKADPTLVPFSLDGLTMGPKPLNPKIDGQFKPSQTRCKELEELLGNKTLQQSARDQYFLLDAMAPIIAEVFLSLDNKLGDPNSTHDEIEQLVHKWVDDQYFEHECFLSTKLPPAIILDRLIAMADGSAPVSLDYCLGQVWRHCQLIIYATLSHSHVSDDALAKIIFMDESIKRYSFGPPVESLQQLKALYLAGVLDLRFLGNPKIECTNSGWLLASGNDKILTTVMIDAVLDLPKIRAVTSPLMKTLLSDGVLKEVHDELGVSTTEDGFVILDSANKSAPLAVLGRLAKGTVIGVDAIIECFGRRPRMWAKTAASMAKNQLTRDQKQGIKL